VRLVKGGQTAAVMAKILGVPEQSLGNWVRLSSKGLLSGAGDKPVSAEQMELARLRAENARLKMERDILKNATVWPSRGAQQGGLGLGLTGLRTLNHPSHIAVAFGALANQ